MYIVARKLKEKYESNVLCVMPHLMIENEWVSFDWLWFEVVLWEK